MDGKRMTPMWKILRKSHRPGRSDPLAELSVFIWVAPRVKHELITMLSKRNQTRSEEPPSPLK